MAKNRILVTHVGSLARPKALLDGVAAILKGDAVDEGKFDRCLTESVTDVVVAQKRAGVDIVSDGEFGKFRGWAAYSLSRLDGFDERDFEFSTGAGKDQQRFPEFYAEYFPTQNLTRRGALTCVRPIKYKGQAALRRDIDNLKAGVAKAGGVAGFLPVVAPASAMPRYRNEFYKSEEEFFFALADALREEYVAILDAGLLLQVDDAFLPYMWDVAFADQPLENYKKLAALRVDALNHA
ncbi:MAG: hypothetical protein ACREFC_08765, partial [Stellaceae bacterium]